MVYSPLLAVNTRVGKLLDTGHKMGDLRCICIDYAYHVFRTSAMVRLRTRTCLRFPALARPGFSSLRQLEAVDMWGILRTSHSSFARVHELTMPEIGAEGPNRLTNRA